MVAGSEPRRKVWSSAPCGNECIRMTVPFSEAVACGGHRKADVWGGLRRAAEASVRVEAAEAELRGV